jgi:nucleoside-diphosphate-sugar epimerase
VSWSHGPHETRTGRDSAPQNHYALTKLWAEQMGEMYARNFSTSVIAARIGWMVRSEAEGLAMRARTMMRNYISRRDIAHFMASAIETTEPRFGVFYAIGPDGRDCYDIEAPRSAIGFEPLDHFPAGLPFALPEEPS